MHTNKGTFTKVQKISNRLDCSYTLNLQETSVITYWIQEIENKKDSSERNEEGSYNACFRFLILH